jgi:hypothetical protein
MRRILLLSTVALVMSVVLASPAQAQVNFGAHTDFTAGDAPRSVAVGDFDGDGNPDLAVTNTNSDNVSVLLGNGDGTFDSATNYALGRFPTSVAVGDLNGDGNPDLAVTNANSDNVSVLLNDPVSDTTAPMLNLPGNFTVEATRPTGATVSYTATATDETDPIPPVVSCDPASDSTFPIGTTTVECTATDNSGNTASGSFTVTVIGATDQISALKELVTSLPGLPAGTNTALQAKLNNALSAANGGDTASACTALVDFNSQVRAQAGKKKISVQDAEELITEAQRIQAVLECS